MTNSPEHDPPLSAAQEAAVRRALAEAGGPEPMPGEVAERLDKVIAGLVSERAGTTAVVADPEEPDPAARHDDLVHPPPGVVVPLDAAARRRRTRVRILMGAAAAVVAVGVGAGVVGSGMDSADPGAADEMVADNPARSAEGSPSMAPPAADDAEGKAENEADPGPAESGPPTVASVEPHRLVTREPVRMVRAAHLREDLLAVRHASLPHPATADYSRTTLTAPANFICEEAAWGRGYLVGVEYDGRPALVAFREPMGSSQVAEVLACGTGDVIHSTTLNAGG